MTCDLTIQRALIPVPEEEGPAASPSIFESEFFRGVSGRGHLRIPRNAWVRSSDFNAEVQGELDVEKEGDTLILFGELDAIRGQYIFQNARFSIARGELRYRGLAGEDPEIYVVGVRRLARVLPDASGKLTQDLTVSIVVGGTLNKPQISLESDAPMPLDQADILSYALFGRPSSQALLAPFGGGTGGGFQSQAQSLVVGLTANRLKQTVGRELGLDVLEVEMGKETLTHLAVGKYVSRDLLLTFSQDLVEAGGQGQDRLGRKVAAEYEFSRNIGLIGSVDDQKKTSLDLFWKKEW
jgi:autotransporter translocation and assembly factor TamB